MNYAHSYSEPGSGVDIIKSPATQNIVGGVPLGMNTALVWYGGDNSSSFAVCSNIVFFLQPLYVAHYVHYTICHVLLFACWCHGYVF
jgi:hypothetical protein